MELLELTTEQEALIGQYLDNWRDLELCTKPVDRAEAKEVIAELYRLIGLSEPVIIWLESPWQILVTPYLIQSSSPIPQIAEQFPQVLEAIERHAGSALTAGKGLGRALHSRLWTMYGRRSVEEVDSDKYCVGLKAGANQNDFLLLDNLQKDYSKQTEHRWVEQLRRDRDARSRGLLSHDIMFFLFSETTELAYALADQTDPGIYMEDRRILPFQWARARSGTDLVRGADVPWHKDTFMETLVNTIWCPWSLYELANLACPYELFNENFYREKDRICLETWLKLLRSVGPCAFYENICLVSNRPNCAHADERNRLHNANGPVLAFDDGLSVYAWHGVKVSEEVILNPENIRVESIQEERNVERRRVMLERFGWERFLRETQAEKIAEDAYGELYRVEFRNDEPLVMVKVMNSTPEPDGEIREYFLRVPPNMRTAKEAVAWTFGLHHWEYGPIWES